ncbi:MULTISPECIES: amidohydrolase [Actinosynnema]|uniref:amidohydrolase family protein n=1 Tax=Actinosynnema TaxID=40566 RepID=UPI0020A27236|nr:amidohydrolase family protein [Actinosynnema pretiosum]MCP2096576.1 putative metal-dependent hydrolase, TIM-barrel fold [Actinosynnema pretiosum]
MEVVDAHLHLPSPRLDWPHGEASRRDLQAELLLAQLDAAGVDAAVLVAVPGVAPLDECLEIAAEHPDRVAVIAPWEGDLARVPEGALGVRLVLSWPPENAERLRSGGYDGLFDAAERRGVPVSVLATGLLPEIAEVARARPSLRLVVDHLGLDQPPYLPAGDPPWGGLPDLLAMAGLENVAVKLSGAPTLSAEPYPYRDVWPHLDRVLSAFGADRCLWGSDAHRVSGRLRGFPPVPPYPGQHSHAQALHHLLDRVGLGEAERAALFGGTARRVLGWPARS